ncbi:MAG: hypothetical protein H7Y07_03270 [Pyrinomonadaceae bacterium]|nr:hypothetical protein [Sphingobacteriaceae bacterium]
MRISKSACSSLLLIILLFNSILTFSQNLPPPTSGAGPADTKTKIPAAIYPIAGGLIVGAAVYYLIKKNPRKISTAVYIDDYLWQNNILPTADAIKICYALNPGIKDISMISPKYKLILPDLPDLPNTTSQSFSPDAFLPSLNEQFILLKSNLTNFRKKQSANTSLNKLNNYLNDTEKEVASYRERSKEIDPQKTELVLDLLTVLNQTLKATIRSDKINENDTRIIENICQNLFEVLEPISRKKVNTGRQSTGYFKPVSDQIKTFYASMDAIDLDKISKTKKSINYASVEKTRKSYPNDERKYFAIAICKIKGDGTPVTRGPDVEKKYIVRYVCPALKDFKTSYHKFPEPATWSVAKLYPSKYYFEILLGANKVSLQEPLIDVLDFYKNKKPGKPNEAIKILINIYE